jgi:hypothetical protein
MHDELAAAIGNDRLIGDCVIALEGPHAIHRIGKLGSRWMLVVLGPGQV